MTPLRKEQLSSGVLALLAVCAVVAVALTSQDITTSEQAARPQNLLSAFYESEVQRISLTGKDLPESGFVLQRRAAPAEEETGEPGTWNLTSPITEEVDVAPMKEYLGALRFAKWTRQLAPDASRSALGLEQPYAVLEVDMVTARYSIKLGGTAPRPEGARYVELAGDGVPNSGVYVVPKSVLDDLLVAPDHFRVKRLVPYAASDLVQVVMTGAGGVRRFQRKPDGAWYFQGQNGDARLERDAIDRVFLQLGRTRAEQFVSVADANEWLQAGSPKTEIELTPEKDAHLKLEVGGACPERGAETSQVVAIRREPDPVAACVNANVMVGLTTQAADMVDRHLSRLHLDEVEALIVEDVRGGESRRLELERNAEGYRLRAPSEGQVTTAAGDARVRSVLEVQGEPIVSPPAPEASLERLLVVTVRSADGAPEVVNVFRHGADVWAHRVADGIWLALPNAALDAFRVDATLLRSLDVLRFAAKRLSEFSSTGETRQHFTVDHGGSATLAEPKGLRADAAAVFAISKVLSELTALRWVADQREPKHGFTKPTLTVHFTLRPEKGDTTTMQHVLLIGKRAQGGYFATLDEDPAVFVLGLGDAETLMQLALDRTVFDFGWDETRTLTLRSAGSSVTLRRVGSALVPSAALGMPLEALKEALLEVRAHRVVHVGPARAAEGFREPTLRVDIQEADRHKSYEIGARDVYQDDSGYYARVQGVNATYFIPSGRIRPLLDALR